MDAVGGRPGRVIREAVAGQGRTARASRRHCGPVVAGRGGRERHALVANHNGAMTASDRAATELGEFADGLRRPGDDGAETTAAALDEVNA